MVSQMPFGSVGDYAKLLAVHPDRIRERLRKLFESDYVNHRSFGTTTLRSERRWWATTHGYRARLGIAQTDEERARVQREWCGLGVMSRRADVAAVVMRMVTYLASHVSDPSTIRLNFFDAQPLDCLVELSGNHFLSVIHAGPALRHRSIWDRLKVLADMNLSSQYLLMIIAPTIHDRNIFLIHARRLKLNCVVATESSVISGGTGWLDTATNQWASYKQLAEKRMVSLRFTRDQSPVEMRHLELPFLEGRTTPVRKITESPALNTPPLGKRFLDTLVHWPILHRFNAQHILGVSASQLSDLLKRLRARDLIVTEVIDGDHHYYLSDDAISYIAARDRCDSAAMHNLLSGSQRFDVPMDASRKRVIASRRGSLIRSRLTNFRHDGLVSEALGYLIDELPANAGWRVIQFLSSPRSRISLTPGSRTPKLRGALLNWRLLATKRKGINERSSIVTVPDALVFIEAGEVTLRIGLEVELTATTRKEWQDRLEAHMLHSLLRSPEQLVLFVIGTPESEQTALEAQTYWVQRDRTRPWPVATTTVDLIQTELVTDPIWRVDSGQEGRISLVDLPKVMNES